MAQQPPFAQSLSVSNSAADSVEHPERIPAWPPPSLHQHLRRRSELPHRLCADLEALRSSTTCRFACSARSAISAPRARGSTSSSFPTRWRPGAVGIGLPHNFIYETSERQFDLPRGAVPVEPAIHAAASWRTPPISFRNPSTTPAPAGAARAIRRWPRTGWICRRSAASPASIRATISRSRSSTAPAWGSPAARW